MTDVAIIGAGLAGLSCAWSLEAAGLSVTCWKPVTRQGAGCALTWWTAFGLIADSR